MASYGAGGGDLCSRLLTAVLPLMLIAAATFMCEMRLAEGKGVHVTMVAPWTETPFLQEGCEWAAAIATGGNSHSRFYWCLHDVWDHVKSSNISGDSTTMTQKSQYELVLNVMKSAPGQTSSQLGLLKMSLAARVYSPAVEAHWQLARRALHLSGGCSAERRPFALVGGTAFCDEHLLHDALASQSAKRTSDNHANGDDADTKEEEEEEEAIEVATLFPDLDHIHPNSGGRRVVVLYGVVGDEPTMRLLHTVERHLHSVRLAFRHLPVWGRSWESALSVQGYGVTVDLKNVEYKAVDEKAEEAVNESPEHDKKRRMEDGASSEPIGGFDMSLLKQRHPGLKDQLSSFEDFLSETLDADEVKVDFHMWEVQHMGVAAAEYVMKAQNEERLNSLSDLLMNFPLHASSLSKKGSTVDKQIGVEVQRALVGMSSMVNPGESLVLLNGRPLQLEELSLFTFLEELKADEQLLGDMTMALTNHRVASASSDDVTAEKTENMLNKLPHWVMQNVSQHLSPSGSKGEDAIQRIWIPHENIIWMNDIENDPQYAMMPRRLRDILFNGFNGMPNIPKKNLLNVVCIIDPTTVEGNKNIDIILNMMQHGQPIRMGVVFADTKWSPNIAVTMDGADIVAETSLSSTTMLISATVWELLSVNNDIDEALSFLSYLGGQIMSQHTMSENDVYVSAMDFLSNTDNRAVSDIIADPSFLRYYHGTQERIHSLHMGAYPVTLINGNMFRGGVLHAMRSGIEWELQYLQQLVREGKLKDGEADFYESILRLSGAKPRYLASLYEGKKYMNWASKPVLEFLQYRPFLLAPSHAEGESVLVSSLLTMRAPLRTQGLNALLKATGQLLHCEAAHECNGVRLTYAICGATKKAEGRTVEGDLERLLLLLENGGKTAGGGKGLELLHEFANVVAPHAAVGLDNPDLYQGVLSTLKLSPDLEKLLEATVAASDAGRQDALVNGFCSQMQMQSALPFENTEEDSSTVYYYANGRRVAYIDSFLEEDFETVALQELPFATAVWKILKDENFQTMGGELLQGNLDDRAYASKTAAIAALLRLDRTRGKRIAAQHLLPHAPGPASFETRPADGTDPRHYLIIVIDPIARRSQLLVSLCKYITRSPIGGVCTVHLNPLPHAEKPMRNFYQFVGDVQLQFDSAGRVVPPAAVFRRLPSQHLLTLGIEDPESWTVFPMEAKYDLDNILLSKLPQTSQYLYATYRVNSILITGSAAEAGTSWPPKGLPLLIRSSLDPATSTTTSSSGSGGSSSSSSSSTGVTRDTLVMANLGYFQLQGAPGSWYLMVQPGDIAGAFYISHINGERVRDGTSGALRKEFNYSAGQRIPLVVSSFTGVLMRLSVAKVPGRESASIESLVAASKQNTGRSSQDSPKERPMKPTLNIFSVASGHLYERFLRIMIRSVVNSSSDVHGANTTRIKFWLIENFLSPQFKELVPLLAEHYGFDVGFVTYRWPWWLNRQTEKQRTIWGYKILFLDVLFPLEVERIIFVDADQIVRADLHELYNMDIGNAPMAYTPFCREFPNKNTTNFRFWEKGFWLQHLRGRPYHISAIYLVDVRRLRAIAGGDAYRLVYSQLSRDPNSLANLDQDLPNYMQDQVPVYSLPEEWLWCETWCGAESKGRAKTIDLCNNPLTKIPKLENAKRIIPGWEELDAELEALSESLRRQRSTG